MRDLVGGQWYIFLYFNIVSFTFLSPQGINLKQTKQKQLKIKRFRIFLRLNCTDCSTNTQIFQKKKKNIHCQSSSFFPSLRSVKGEYHWISALTLWPHTVNKWCEFRIQSGLALYGICYTSVSPIIHYRNIQRHMYIYKNIIIIIIVIIISSTLSRLE